LKFPAPAPFALLICLLTSACSTAVSFTPDGDDGALALIENRWGQGKLGLKLSLCEDRSTADKTAPDGCAVQHILKGGGRGKAESPVRGGFNCQDCQYDSAAMVRGTIIGGAFPKGAQVTGVVLARDYNLPYALPYQVELHCSSAGHSCDIAGNILQGKLDLRLVTPAGSGAGKSDQLQLLGKSSCTY